jgi:hypothetical protein
MDGSVAYLWKVTTSSGLGSPSKYYTWTGTGSIRCLWRRRRLYTILPIVLIATGHYVSEQTPSCTKFRTQDTGA